MSLSNFLRALANQPWRSRKILSNLPMTLRGFRFAQEWRSSVPEQVPSADVEDKLPNGNPNPLRSYFDAHKEGKGIWKWLHYFDIYHRHFSKFIGREVHILEIGIYSGGSLEMWREYFGPKCHVYGVDLESACKVYENDYTKIFIGDKTDPEFWQDLREEVPRIDILVDDGGHESEQIIAAMEETLTHLSAGGVYLCEDVHGIHNGFAAYSLGLLDSLNATRTGTEPGVTPTAFQADIQSVHFYPYVVLIEKTDAPVARFIAPKHGTDWQPWL